MKSNLYNFSFVACIFGITSKKSLPNPMSQSFSSVFYSKFYLSLTFKSLIHLELIFVSWYKESNFILLHADIQFSNTICWKVLSPLNGLGTLVKNHLTIHARVYFWAFYCILLVSTCLPLCQHHTLSLLQLYSKFGNQEVWDL